MRVLEQFSTWPFVLYRFMLGVIILIAATMGWLV
jgi:undecaprenyl-diphosphatase